MQIVNLLNSRPRCLLDNDIVVMTFGNLLDDVDINFDVDFDVVYNPYIIGDRFVYCDHRLLPDGTLYRSPTPTASQIPNCSVIVKGKTAKQIYSDNYQEFVNKCSKFVLRNTPCQVYKEHYSTTLSGMFLEVALFNNNIASVNYSNLFKKYIDAFDELKIYNVVNTIKNRAITISHGKVDTKTDYGSTNASVVCKSGFDLPSNDNVDIAPTVFYNRSMSIMHNPNHKKFGYVSTKWFETFSSWIFAYDTPPSIVMAIIAIRCNVSVCNLVIQSALENDVAKYLEVLLKFAKSRKVCLNITYCYN